MAMDPKQGFQPYQSAEEAKRDSDRRFWEDAAGSLGGTVAGVAAGIPFVPLYDHLQRMRIEKAINERAALFEHNQEILRTLKGLHRGNISWDDIEPGAKPMLEQMYEEHKPLLNDGYALATALREQPPAQVVRLPGVPRIRFSQLLPSVEMLKHPISILQHPVPATLGLIGGFAGGYAMERKRMERMYDKIKSWEEGSEE
jgi:hypothetical protein